MNNEIEAQFLGIDKNKIREKLGLNREKAKFGLVDSTYRHYYGIDEDIIYLHTPKILFEMELPEWAKKKIK